MKTKKRRQSETESLLQPLLASGAIRTHFMPIMDVVTGSVFGYELVARGAGDLRYPRELFRAAEREGLRSSLDEHCRDAALTAVSRLHPEQRNRWKFFVNTSLRAFLDPEFRAAFEVPILAEHGIPPDAIVIELTDRDAVTDMEAFESAAADALRRGIRIALDDLGSQQSGLIQLAAAKPQFIKIDRQLVSRLEGSAYRQILIRTIEQFAASVDTRVVAEGVETFAEVDALLRLGIRYMQGYLFGKPAAVLEHPPAETMELCRKRVRRHLELHATSDEALGILAVQPPTTPLGGMTVFEVDQFFISNPQYDHLVVLKSERPHALVTRQAFYANLAGPGALEMVGRRSVETLADPDPLILSANTSILAAARIAMNRLPERFNDPILVADAIGGFAGSISVRSLLGKTLDLEVQRARDTNPLTGLPGNRAIERWIAECYALPQAAVVYVDLDRFKEFNDVFGFLRGDEVLRFTARLLQSHLGDSADDLHIGHIGGDDFVVVSRKSLDGEMLECLCRAFDEGRNAYFTAEQVTRGTFTAHDREGRRVDAPLLTMSLAVIPSVHISGAGRVGDLSARAARIKSLAKRHSAARGRSSWVVELCATVGITT